MADDLVNRIITTTIPKFFKGFQDGVSKMAVEFYWADKHDLYTFNQGGREIQWRIRVQRGSPFGYSGGTESKTFAVRNDYQVATLPWRGIADGIVLTEQELWQCKGPEQIIAVLPQLLADMKSDLVDEFCTSFYSDGTRLNSKTFHGLAASIGSAQNLTYAGLSQSTYTAWANQAIDGTGFSGDPLSKLLSLLLACAVGEKGGRTRNQLSIFLTDKTQFATVMNSEAAKQRYTRDVEMAKAGFMNIECWGVPLAWSEYATATTVFGLNHNLFEFIAGTPELFVSKVQDTVGFPSLKLGVGVSHFNLLNKNPRGSGLIYTIT